MTWTVRATGVEQHELGLRWALDAWTSDLTTTVTADSTHQGHVFDFQSDGYYGTAGDEELDYQVALHIRNLLALRNVMQSLDAIDHQRSRRASGRRDWRA